VLRFPFSAAHFHQSASFSQHPNGEVILHQKLLASHLASGHHVFHASASYSMSSGFEVLSVNFPSHALSSSSQSSTPLRPTYTGSLIITTIGSSLLFCLLPERLCQPPGTLQRGIALLALLFCETLSRKVLSGVVSVVLACGMCVLA